MYNQVSQLAYNFIYELTRHNIIPSDRWVHNNDHFITQSNCQAVMSRRWKVAQGGTTSEPRVNGRHEERSVLILQKSNQALISKNPDYDYDRKPSEHTVQL